MRPAWDDFEDDCRLEIKPNSKRGKRVIITHEPTGLKVEKLLEGKAFNFAAVNALYNELEIMVKEQRKDEKNEREGTGTEIAVRQSSQKKSGESS